MPDLTRDLRYGLRVLRNSPGFTLVALLALALGIGANSAIFSVVDSVLLRPLPVPGAREVMVIWENNTGQGWNRTGPAGPNFFDWREQNHSFSEMTALDWGTATITGFGEPEQVPGMRVTANYFDFLRAEAAVGRTFVPAEGHGRHNVAVVSHEFWTRHFGRNGTIGAKIISDGIPYQVIGVLPPGAWTPIPSEVYVPWNEAELRGRGRLDHDLGVLVRLKPGVTVDQAREDVNAIQRRIAAVYPQLQGWGAIVVPLQEALYGGLRTALVLVLAAVGFVLLIACANLANLLLARGAAREKETAIRTALGAGRRRLFRQYLTESLLLGVLGGALGLVLALWGVDFLERTVPRSVALGEAAAPIMRPVIAMDWRVLVFTGAVSILTGVLFGLAPAFAAARPDLSGSLKEGGRSTSSRARLRLRNLLVVSEVALAMVLLIAAGLTLKSFWNARRSDPGFRLENVLTMEMELPTDSRYRTGQEQREVFRRILERVRQSPGVSSAALANVLPMDPVRDDRTSFLIEGRAPLAPGQRLSADYRSVSPEWFRTMGIALVGGRVFDERDTVDRPLVAVIDETAARRYFNDGRDPIGQRVILGTRTRDVVREVVGVVSSVRGAGLDKLPAPTLYAPFLQSPRSRMCLAVRAEGDPTRLVRTVKGAVYAVDKDQPVYNVRTMQALVSGSQDGARFTLILLGIFGAVALALAAVGIYGVISYSVAQRTGEIGIRIALGAQASSVLALVVRQGMTLAGAGVLIGLAAAFALTRLLSSLLYGISPTDAGVFAATAGALALVALAASYIPARRAARVDPIVSLRYE